MNKMNLSKSPKWDALKTTKKMSKEELLIALLNSKQSHVKLYKSKSSNTEIEETRKILMN